MDEQTAVLVEDHGEWILATGDDEPERVWKNLDTAMSQLPSDGLQIVQGPAPIRPSMAGLARFNLWGYRLKRSVQ